MGLLWWAVWPVIIMACIFFGRIFFVGFRYGIEYQVGVEAGQKDNRLGIRIFHRPSGPGEEETALVKGYNDGWEETAERRLTFFNRERGSGR